MTGADKSAYGTDLVQTGPAHVVVGDSAVETKYVRLQSG
ncbi:hypothetical protein G155_00172 [Mycobacterium sp. VKM Ac-1817D]|nr:hypothetical protein G155_00172 [Mycobacterium sp. VKM Ac-1817D]